MLDQFARSMLGRGLKGLLILAMTLASITPIALGVEPTLDSGPFRLISSNEMTYQRRSFTAPQPLRMTTPVRAMMSRSLIVPGGVAFDKIAGSPGIQAISASYDATLPDGQRWSVVADGRSFPLTAYDWQVVPLVRVVDKGHTALVTFEGFGGGYMVRLAENLVDEPLGLRIANADWLVMTMQRDSTSAATLPAVGGMPLLFPGERRFTTQDRAASRAAARQLMAGSRRALGGAFAEPDWESYTWTSGSVTLAVENGTLKVTGKPLVKFWKAPPEAILGQMLKVLLLTEKLNDDSRKAVEACLDAGKLTPDVTALLTAEWAARMKQLKAEAMQEVPPADRALAMMLVEAELGKLQREFEGLLVAGKLDSPVIEGKVTTQYFANNAELLEASNPVVYNAVQTTAQWTAILRRAKQDNPLAFANLVTAVAGVPNGDVRTPRFLLEREPAPR